METIIEYSGYLNHKIVTTLISELESQKKDIKVTYNVFKKILTIMVELLENSYHYSNKISEIESVGKYPKTNFLIEKKDKKIVFTSGNVIKLDDWKVLSKKLKHLNNLDWEELREEYKSLLKQGIYHKSGSAGIGLLRIRKMIKNKLDYKIEELDMEYGFFKMIINLKF